MKERGLWAELSHVLLSERRKGHIFEQPVCLAGFVCPLGLLPGAKGDIYLRGELCLVL
jgi:hypothetical protein